MELGYRCRAGRSEKALARTSGSMEAMAAASSFCPNRCWSSYGPWKAHSSGICWSRTIPIRSASGSEARRASASGSPARASVFLTTPPIFSDPRANIAPESQKNRCGAWDSGVARVGSVDVDAVLGDGVGHLFGLAVATGPQAVEHGHDQMAGVDFEVAAQGGPRVGA